MRDAEHDIGESVCGSLRDSLRTEADHIRWGGEQALVRLADRLHTIRLERGISQIWLAKAVGTGQANISDIENADANPTVRTVGRLARALGLDVAELFQPAPRCHITEGVVGFIDAHRAAACYRVSEPHESGGDQGAGGWNYRNVRRVMHDNQEQANDTEPDTLELQVR